MPTNTDHKIRLDYNNMMQEFVGIHGYSPEDLTSLSEKVSAASAAMKTKRANGQMDWRDLPHNQDGVVADILAYVAAKADAFDSFVVLGIGGSALGPMAVQQAINHPYYNELPRCKRGGYPKFYVVDNIDPERLVYLFDIIDASKCLFNVVSKSGSTSETMSQ
ncbi:MAG: glucose-6-phosphate isomerase, partial [Defluviitaleaceae bacterium]|nr:glucose-6-phosphate isomerase [Defluviitaleaceae bacterium]